MTTIFESISPYLPSKSQVSNGWITFDAVCCPHFGETQDKRKRGHLRVEVDGSLSYGCFNCGFKFKHQIGHSVSFKFKKFLQWLHVDESVIIRISLEALREKELQIAQGIQLPPKEQLVVKFEKKNLPKNAVRLCEITSLLTENNIPFPTDLSNVINYLQQRKIDQNKYDFYWSPDTIGRLNERILIPFTWENNIVGYTGRSIRPNPEFKYKTEIDTGYVFNVDKQNTDWKFVIVSEGPFDAMSVDGVAVLHNKVSAKQIDIIESLEKDIIVVPHKDEAGSKLIDVALTNGWYVSFPTWAETCKDINEAVIQYGKLFVLKDIIENTEKSKLKIKLRKNR